MIDDSLPLISAPTDEELEALRQQVAEIEGQIAAAETMEKLIGLVNTLAGESAANA